MKKLLLLIYTLFNLQQPASAEIFKILTIDPGIGWDADDRVSGYTPSLARLGGNGLPINHIVTIVRAGHIWGLLIQ